VRNVEAILKCLFKYNKNVKKSTLKWLPEIYDPPKKYEK